VATHLKDKVIVITGAASGFGQLVSGLAADRGAKVVGADIHAEHLATTGQMIRERGGVFEAVVADVTVKEQVDAVARQAVDSFGAIDILINNAGVMPLAFFADHADAWEAWDRCIDINFKGVVHGIGAVYDQMLSQGHGHVVNISSIYGNAGTIGSGVYSATKAAVNTLSESLRVETQGRIKVTIIRPTGVPGTGLSDSIINFDAMAGLLGPNLREYMEMIGQGMAGTLPPELSDEDDPRYLSVTPEQIATQIIYAIDQPWGVSIAELTIRATGEGFVI
jgi:NADP-dependent 3-hydroxy acid dehydrogenase YdfG